MTIRRASGLILVAAAGLSPGSAQAGFYSGEALLESCTADRTDKAFFEKSYECVGYVAGAVDAFNTTREAKPIPSTARPSWPRKFSAIPNSSAISIAGAP